VNLYPTSLTLIKSSGRSSQKVFLASLSHGQKKELIMFKLKHLKTKVGITIIEMLISVFILGGMASVMVSNYHIAAKRIMNTEAENVLLAMYMARREYDDFVKYNKIEYDGVQSNSRVTLNDLWTKGGFQVTNYLINFNNIRTRGHDTSGFFGDTIYCDEWGVKGGHVRFFGALDARDGTYSLFIGEDGEFYCTPCDSKTCIKMGYTTADKKAFKMINASCSMGGSRNIKKRLHPLNPTFQSNSN